MNVKKHKKVTALLSGFIICSIFSVIFNADDAFLLTSISVVIAVSVWIRWELRRAVWFWMLMLFWTVVQVASVFVFHLGINVHPTGLLVPLFILDYLIVVYSTIPLERLIGR